MEMLLIFLFENTYNPARQNPSKVCKKVLRISRRWGSGIGDGNRWYEGRGIVFGCGH
jgi:hypothetical protein